MFYSRLKQVCKDKGTTATTVLKQLNISTGAVGNWKKGSLPTGDILAALSTYLDVSMDYLVFGKQPPEPDTILTMADLPADEYNLLSTYREMDLIGKKLLQDQLKFLWADHRQPDSKLSTTSEGNCG